MQRIERYGVIALVFLLVTIMAVALWGQREEQGLLSFLNKGEQPPEEEAKKGGKVAVPIDGNRRPRSYLPINQGSAAQREGSPSRRSNARHMVPESPPSAYRPPSSEAFTAPPERRSDEGRAPAWKSITPEPGTEREPARETPRVAEPRTRNRQAQPRERSAQVVIRRGDTLSHIAQRELGSAQRWREILAVNEGLDPMRLREGTVLRMPTGDTVVRERAAPAEPRPERTKNRVNGSGATHTARYTVQKGDTLSQIALDELGSAQRWKEIAELNPGLDPTAMMAGTSLVMPSDRRAAPPPSVAKSEPAPAPSRPPEVARASTSRGRVR